MVRHPIAPMVLAVRSVRVFTAYNPVGRREIAQRISTDEKRLRNSSVIEYFPPVTTTDRNALVADEMWKVLKTL